MKDFRSMKVWEKAHLLALDSYKATDAFPRTEVFALVSQIRRAAISIAANIAEGCGKRGNAEFQRFLNIAEAPRASWSITFCLHVTYISLTPNYTNAIKSATVEVKRMLAALIRKIEAERLAG